MPSRKSWREKLADSKDLPKIQKAEGHKVVSKGKKFIVEDFEKSLARL